MAINPVTYIKESKAELDKVVWPTKNEVLRLTLVVLFISIAIGAYIAGLDALLAKITAIVFKF